MKFCPICKTRYDEEILRFCTKDGTPLIDEEQPNFTALPSESDLDEETVIRRKDPTPPNPQPDSDLDFETGRNSSSRIIIPMSGESVSDEPQRQPVRTKTTPSIRRQPLEKKSNTPLVVFLTVLGTVVILAGGIGIVSFLSNQNAKNSNQNTNFNTNLNSIDINLNTNLNTDSSLANFNYNLNANTNANSNINANANLKTPTPIKTPTVSPTPNENANGNINAAVNMDTNALPSANTKSPPRPLPTVTPLPSPSGEPSNRPVNAGILNSRAVNLTKPAYPPQARQMGADGQVVVQVLVDETGNVTSAKALSGNLLLRASAEAAARQSRFNPVRVDNQAVKATGVVLYNFINQ